MNNKRKAYLFDAIGILFMLILDQWTKWLAIRYLKDAPAHPLIKDVLELQYLENRGSAFGMLQGQKILLLTIGVVFVAVLIYFLWKIPAAKNFTIFHILISAIIAGGIGNIIDRVRFDYVVDFIYFKPINFPIFNVADIYISVSTVIVFIILVFFMKDEDFTNTKGKEKPETEEQDGKDHI